MATHTSIRKALRWRLPPLRPSPDYYTARPKNTESADPIEPETWELWPEFRHDVLSGIFARELDKTYHGPPLQRARDRDTVISSEDTVTAAYFYFIWPIVNDALGSQEGKPHYSVGSRYSQYADWLCVRDADGKPRLAGDTKVHFKWNPAMLDSWEGDFDDDIYKQWQQVVGQIQGYAVGNETRYAFCVTDGGVTVVRLRISDIPRSQVVLRSQGSMPQSSGHNRGLSDTSMATAATTDTASSGSPYNSDNVRNHPYEIPQYAFIPWERPNENRLTPSEALFFLALMAVNGDNYIARTYPRLNSYRLCLDGSYVHNTSGRVGSKQPQGAVREEPAVDGSDLEMVVETMETEDQTQGGTQGYMVNQELTEASSYAGEGYEDEGHNSEVDNQDLADNYGEGPSQITYQSSTAQSSLSLATGKAPELERIPVTIEGSRRTGLYFTSARGDVVSTSRSKWTKVQGVYELEAKHHIYYTKSFPK